MNQRLSLLSGTPIQVASHAIRIGPPLAIHVQMTSSAAPAHTIRIRTGQGPAKLEREAFGERFRNRFDDPLFDEEKSALVRLEQLAWNAYQEGRKAPRTALAGTDFFDPSYHLSVEWLDTRLKLRKAQQRFLDKNGTRRILLISGSARNDKTCPGEMAKSYRLIEVAKSTLEAEGADVDVLDLSLLTSEYGREIHPCKGCVSTAMPLCHWPCSCYPHHSLGQVNDWMAEIYERWVLAHGIIIITPVYWYQTPSVLKLMIDRLVCADGGNPDPTTTHGKTASEAKAIEVAGWDYPKHLANRTYGVVVHGDAAGADPLRYALCEWLDCMGLLSAGPKAKLDRYIGYYESYAESHEALDRDEDIFEEVRNVAKSVALSAEGIRKGVRLDPGAALQAPRAK